LAVGNILPFNNRKRMAQYKVTYYNVKGRGELIRLVFVVAGVDFEDTRFTSKEQWEEVKPNTPLGQCPVLEFDGHMMCQSITIARFLANRFGLAGKSDLEKAWADMVVDCVMDLINGHLVDTLQEKNEEKKEEMKKKLFEEQVPASFGNLEKLLKQNNGGDGYFVGDSLTWADLAVMDILNWLDFFNYTPDMSAYPKTKALIEKLHAHPKIAEWMKKW